MIAYTGNGAYCYANSLHMCLRAARIDVLPDPGFLECLTIMPFGASYLRLGDGPAFFPSPPGVDPDSGLSTALKSMGWACEERHGGGADEALGGLREALKYGPALIGRLDMGYLSCDPDRGHKQGADHFIVVLSVDHNHVRVHDPGGYPFAVLPTTDLMQAWQAQRIGYGKRPYNLRAAFRQVERVTRAEMLARTIPTIREEASEDPGGPIVYGSVQALRLVAEVFRDEVPAPFADEMIYFVIPLGARRCMDAAGFLREASLEDAANCAARKAKLFGQAQYHAVQGQWDHVADIFENLADAESKLISALW